MKKIILLNKREGQTPLEALIKFRKNNKVYKNIPMTYAGRLDPMASGLLLVLAGEEVHKKEKYLKLPKEYQFKVLFGFATDTYDILGLIMTKKILNKTEEKELEKNIKGNLKYFIGKFMQKYPMYSSRTIKGKPLFKYAREGEDVEAPERQVFVKNFRLKSFKKLERKKLLANIVKRIEKVKGDFRQEQIIKAWTKELSKNKNKVQENFFVADLTIKCSSGTYVRSIANSLGEHLGIPALAFSIRRIKLGKWRQVE